MNDFLHKLKMSIIEKTIYDLLKASFLLILTTGITGVLAHMITTEIHYFIQYSMILSISAAGGIGFICITLLKHKFAYDYRILEKEYEYKYKSVKRIIFKKRFKIKALTKKCDRLYDKFNWTGSGKVNIKCEDLDLKIMMIPRTDNFQRLEVTFGRNLTVGEVIEVVLIYTLEDPDKSSIPYLCTTVVEPTDSQILRVIVPEEFNIIKANTDIRRSVESHISDSSEMKLFRNGICEWKISKPKLHYVYSIKWNMDHAKE